MKKHMVAAIEGEYRRYKALAEGTFSQLAPGDLLVQTTPESLSIAMIVWHVSGNLQSRFTDFLTTDGEKPWRDRESEFAERRVDRKEMLAKWERGWSVLFEALESLSDRDLTRMVTIRGISATVGEALARSLGHTTYHVGQITFLGKMLRRSQWKYLSIPPGKSAAYNANPTLEKSRLPAASVKPTSRKKSAMVEVKNERPTKGARRTSDTPSRGATRTTTKSPPRKPTKAPKKPAAKKAAKNAVARKVRR